MPQSRRENRESAFILIFEKLFRNDTIDEIIELADNIDDICINSDVINMFEQCTEKSSQLDEIISKYSAKRTIDRIPKVNLALLRLALYEAIFDERVPLSVAINESVILAKKYAQEPDVAFINGVLGAYARDNEEK